MLFPANTNLTRPLERLREQFDRMFDEAFSSYELSPANNIEREGIIKWNPSVEAFEDDKQYTIKASLSGIPKEDIQIELDEDSLTISGERKFHNEVKKDDLYRKEIAYGKFQRSFQLARPVDTEKVTHEYKDGLLTLRLPKKEVTKNGKRKITL